MRTTWKAGAIAGLALSLFAIAPAAAAPKGGPPASAGNRLVVNTVTDTPDAKLGDGRCADAGGKCSLRARGPDRQRAQRPGHHRRPGGTYALTGSDLDVARRVRILADGATIKPSGIRAFDVTPGADLALYGATITGGSVAGAAPLGNSGGAILNQGTLLVDGVTLTGNSSAGRRRHRGHGRLAHAPSLRVTLTDNETGPHPGNGGGFHLTGAGTVDIIDSMVTGNSATNEGGGVWNSTPAP